MFHYRWVVWLLLGSGGLLAQMPLRVSAHELAEVAVTAVATEHHLIVDLVIAEGWHAYAQDVGGGIPVTVELAEDCDFVAAGACKLPAAVAGKVTGRCRWQLPIRARGEGENLRAIVWFQICDALECYEPVKVDISGNLRALSVLLVVGERSDRDARIEQFLKKRACEVSVTTYAEVTAALCDRHDVVLADSKLFRKTAKVRKHVLAFPATDTPIVAVGFYGTELIEAHGVAMTSGYI